MYVIYINIYIIKIFIMFRNIYLSISYFYFIELLYLCVVNIVIGHKDVLSGITLI